MSGSFRNIIQVSEKSAHEPEKNKTLSIGFFPDGFVFAVLNNDSYRYVALEEYHILAKHGDPPQDYFQQLERFCKTHPILNKTFQKVHCVYYTPQLVLIPEEVYDDNLKEDYFGFCACMQKDNKIIADRLNILDSRGIYAVPDQLCRFLESSFPGYRLKHHGVVLIESTLAAQKLEPWQADAVIHLRKNHFEILLIDNQRLTCYQSFSCKAFDDVLYYLFYVLGQHKLDATNLHLLLMGELAMDTAEYDTLASFFKKVTFPERNDVFQYSDAFENVPAHFYYNLLNLITCG